MSTTSEPLARAMRQIRAFAGERVDDSELLKRFQQNRDDAAFAEIVRRHGPLVLGVARRWLADRHEAEDVVQATFLALSRQAKRLDLRQPLSGWLYTVAFRLARKAQVRSSRRGRLVVSRTDESDPLASITGRELLQALDAELARLPERYRLPLLVCGLDGLTRDEAAERLGCSAGALKGRLERGRELLRKRLEARGLTLPAALAGVLVADGSTAMSAPFVAAVTKAALAATAGAAIVSLKMAALAGVLLVAMGTGAGLALWGEEKAPPKPPVAHAPGLPEVEPLPPGGIARIGTTRFRHSSWHKRVFFSADGKSLIETDDGSKVLFWDIATGRKTSEFEIPQGHFRDADFAPATGVIAVIGQQFPKELPAAASQITEAVWLIDTVNQKLIHTLAPDLSRVSGHKARLSKDGKRAVSHVEGDLRVWDVKSGTELKQFSPAMGVGSTALAISPDGKTIAFGHFDVVCWKWETEAEPRKITTIRPFGTELIEFGPDGKLYVARGALKVFDVDTGRQVGLINTIGKVNCLAFSPDGKSLAVGYHSTRYGTGLEKTVAVIDLKTGRERTRFEADQWGPYSVAWSTDSTRLAAGSSHRLYAWDVASGQSLGPPDAGHAGSIDVLAFAADGRLFTGSDDHTVRSWDAATGKAGLTLSMNGWVRALALSPDESLIAGSALGNDLRVWDARTGVERYRLFGHGAMGGMRRVRFSADGQRLISFGDDDMLRVFDMRNGKLISEYRMGPELPEGDNDKEREMRMMMLSATFSPDGKALGIAVGSNIQVFDTANAKQTVIFDVEAGGGQLRLAFSADSLRLAIAGRSKKSDRLGDWSETEYQVEVWDLAAKSRIWKSKGPGIWPSAVEFSPDGLLLAATAQVGQHGGSIRFWDAATGREHGMIESPVAAGPLAFDRTGKRLAVAFRNTSAVVYDLQSAIKPVASPNGGGR